MSQSKKLHFDPTAMPAGREQNKFKHWFRKACEHHEYHEVADRLAQHAVRVSVPPSVFEGYFLWESWRAATWNPDEDHASIILKAKEALGVGDELGFRRTLDQLPISHRYGPFLYLEDVINHKRRQPDAATMLAADLATQFRCQGIKSDWALIAKLAAVAGIDDSLDRTALRVAAGKFLKAMDRGEMMLIGWPKDTGESVRAIFKHLDCLKEFRKRSRTK